MKNSAAAFIIVLAAPFVHAQAFDAASLKPGGDIFVMGVTSKMKGGPGTDDPGRITYTQVGLRELLMKAWGMKAYQISGPDWLRDPRAPSYTITATMPPDTTKEKFQAMLQNLLIERFHMKVHHETRKITGYELVVVPGGSKLKETTQDPDAPEGHIVGGVDKDGFVLLPPGHAAAIAMSGGATRVKFQSYTIPELVNGYLPAFVSQADGGSPGPLMDNTGLTARYDFTLVFDARSQAAAVVSPNIGPQSQDNADPSGAPNLFNAIEKQLGLKLIKVKDVPVDILIIDSIERNPIEN